MSPNDRDIAEFKSMDDYIAEAHRLRAEALSDGLAAAIRRLSKAAHDFTALFTRQARA